MTIDLLMTIAVGIGTAYLWTESTAMEPIRNRVVGRLNRSAAPMWVQKGVMCSPCVGFWPATGYAVAQPTWSTWHTIGATAIALVAHLVWLDWSTMSGVTIGALRAHTRATMTKVANDATTTQPD